MHHRELRQTLGKHCTDLNLTDLQRAIRDEKGRFICCCVWNDIDKCHVNAEYLEKVYITNMAVQDVNDPEGVCLFAASNS